jgi:hypothetical protein
MGCGFNLASFPMATVAFLLELKEPEREFYRSTLSSVEVSNKWSYTSLHPHAVVLWSIITDKAISVEIDTHVFL